MATLLRSGTVKTRKEHNCHGCLEIIPKGTYLYYQTGIGNNKIYTIYTCDRCLKWCKGCRDCYEMESAYEGYIMEFMKEREGNQ